MLGSWSLPGAAAAEEEEEEARATRKGKRKKGGGEGERLRFTSEDGGERARRRVAGRGLRVGGGGD